MFDAHLLKKAKKIVANTQCNLSLYVPKINITNDIVYFGLRIDAPLRGLLMFRTQKKVIDLFLNNKLTLADTYLANPEPIVQLKQGTTVKSYTKSEFSHRLKLGGYFFKNLNLAH